MAGRQGGGGDIQTSQLLPSVPFELRHEPGLGLSHMGQAIWV